MTTLDGLPLDLITKEHYQDPETTKQADEKWKEHDSKLEEQVQKHGQFYTSFKPKPHPEMVRQEYFTDKGKTFSPQACAIKLGRNYVFRLHPKSKDLYVFNEKKNLYELADEFVARWVQKELSDLANTSRVHEVEACVKRTAEIATLPHPRYIQLKNCVFDLLEGKPVERRPEWFFTIQFPIEYNPNASPDKFVKFLNEVQPNKNIQKQLLEFLGYCLYNDRPIERSNFILWGTGANGKSTLLNVYREMLGLENIATLSLQELETRFGPINLFDKCANIDADLPNNALEKTSNFKKCTGGDAVYCDRKGKEGYQAVLPAKFIFSANSPPEVPDHEPALFRRLILVQFAQNFEGKEVPNLKNDLVQPEQLSGVFNLVHPLLRDLLKRNAFTAEPTTEETRQLYMSLSRPVFAFIKERLEYPTEGTEEKTTLFKEYVDWAKETKRQIFTFQEFCRRLMSDPELAGLIYRTKDTNLKPCFGGISLKPKTEETPKTTENDQKYLKPDDE